MPAITVDNLTKSFGQTVALDDLSFRVEEGEVFGFLGPNGAGKSTTINIVLDFARPTAGEISVLGMDANGTAETSDNEPASSPRASSCTTG